MFGATRRSWPGAAENTSYCPSTLPDRNASTVPTWAPVTREPIWVTSGLGGAARRAVSRSATGTSSEENPDRLASAQPGRSTTLIGACSVFASSRVNAVTWPSASSARARRSLTTAVASSSDTCGPGRISRRAVAAANSQSTIWVTPPTVRDQPLPVSSRRYTPVVVSGSETSSAGCCGCLLVLASSGDEKDGRVELDDQDVVRATAVDQRDVSHRAGRVDGLVPPAIPEQADHDRGNWAPVARPRPPFHPPVAGDAGLGVEQRLVTAVPPGVRR